MAIERLQEIFRQGINQHILFIKYEDLCLYPDIVMKKIYEYLEIPYYQHDFENIEQITKEDDEVYGMFGDHKIKKTLELTLSDAQKVLGSDICDWIYNNYGWYNEIFKYPKNI